MSLPLWVLYTLPTSLLAVPLSIFLQRTCADLFPAMIWEDAEMSGLGQLGKGLACIERAQIVLIWKWRTMNNRALCGALI